MKTKLCDECGDDIVGKPIPMVDENYNRIGIQCQKCFEESLDIDEEEI